MQRFHGRWPSGILFGVALTALALAGCNVSSTPVPTMEIPEVLPTVVTPETHPTAEAKGTPVGTETAPSTPIIVDLSMNKAPAVNEEAEVILEVRSHEDAPGTTAQIELPMGARLVSGNPSWEGDVSVGSPVRIAITIAFAQEGEYTIQGGALRPVSADMIWGDADYIYLTVKQDSGYFGFESGGETELSTGGSQ